LVKKWMHLDTLKDDIDRRLAGQGELAEPQAAGTRPDLETAPRTPRL
jgi:POT family proton-dependent oligopeptide transporter